MTPYFGTLASALAMDGHGAYVWSAYALVTIGIVLILILPRVKERKVIARIAAELKRQQNRVDPEAGAH